MKNIIIYISLFISGNLSAQVKVVYIASEMDEVHYLDDFSAIEFWGFGLIKPSGASTPSLPGPVLEFNLGDTVEIHFHNKSMEDHTIHLHGLDVITIEDGVPATSFAIDPNDSIVYDFVAKNTGTFLYHCHVLTTLHLTMGMYGVIVVQNYPEQNLIHNGGPSFQQEHVFLASDMDISINMNPLSPGPFNLFVMDYFMINGLSGNQLLTNPDNQVTAYPGDSVLLRLASMAYSKTRFIFPPELNATAYLSDGRILQTPFECDTLIVSQGERYDVLLVPTGITDVDIQVEYYESRNDVMQHINYIELNADVSVLETRNDQFKVYPNPFSNQLQFESDLIGEILFIYDLTGKIVFEKLIEMKYSTLDVSALHNGLYILRYGESLQKIVKC
jgi:FtsP/CotA-like multicopper oxidase with cupredoxin domain